MGHICLLSLGYSRPFILPYQFPDLPVSSMKYLLKFDFNVMTYKLFGGRFTP